MANRCTMWRPEEDELVMARQPVPGRTANAQKARRYFLIKARGLRVSVERWRPEEDALAIAGKQVPGRTAMQVKWRRCRLRKAVGFVPLRSEPWTAADDALLCAGNPVPDRTLTAMRRRRENLRSKGVPLAPMKVRLDAPRGVKKRKVDAFQAKHSAAELANPIVAVVWAATSALNPQIRDIVRSELTIAVLEGSLALADVPKAVSEVKKKAYAAESTAKTVSMDQVRGYGWTLHDRVAA